MNFLEDVKTVGIVGLSRDAKKPSHLVAQFLQKQGVRIIPINPKSSVLLGEKSYTSIADVQKEIHLDVVAIYRNSEAMPAIISEIIQRGQISTIWIPQGAQHVQAELKAFHHGITVITNFCLLHEYKKLVGKKRF
ncbi:MAG: CoA-binding protein [Patescibacteria group bacterium]|nr:CoA-binding protein [Patescibacteria group bacterium]MDE2590873.1 CoA-binding protein [Patescibacteria group bacterium]